MSAIVIEDDEKPRTNLDMPHDMRLVRFANKTTVRLIGKFTVQDPGSDSEPVRVCEIAIDKIAHNAKITINDQVIATLCSPKDRAALENMALGALKHYLGYRIKHNRHTLERKRRRRAEQRAEQQSTKGE